MAYKLLIVRDQGKRGEIDTALPSDWRVMYVGQKVEKGAQGPFELILVGCEMYTQRDWLWYYDVLRELRSNKREPLWTN